MQQFDHDQDCQLTPFFSFHEERVGHGMRVDQDLMECITCSTLILKSRLGGKVVYLFEHE